MTPRNSVRARPARAWMFVAAASSAAALSGCGKLGELDRPGPLFGTAKPANAAQANRAPAGSEDPTQPVRTIDPRDLGIDPVPPRAEPLPGQSSDPTAVQPPGVLPDPYARPQ